MSLARFLQSCQRFLLRFKEIEGGALPPHIAIGGQHARTSKENDRLFRTGHSPFYSGLKQRAHDVI